MSSECRVPIFSPIELRVLGSLMEKSQTTPESYPLTLNSLVLAANQKTSRDPVTAYEAEEIEAALDSLRDLGVALRVDKAGSRTAHFRESLSSAWELDRAEMALLTVLFLRGPQTAGQLRQRCERMFPFSDVDHVTRRLEGLQGKREAEPETLVRALPRQPGTKDQRFTVTCADEPIHTPLEEVMAPARPGLADQVKTLTERVNQLETTLASLKFQLKDLIDDA
jgi:uncharacterized protein YceH (UPF0502 family)